MATKSAFSIVGLAHKVCLAAEAQGYTPELLNDLAEKPDLFGQLLRVQLGHAEIREIEHHVIDCDANPFVPSGLRVEKHKKQGSVKWNPKAVLLYSYKSQEDKIPTTLDVSWQLEGKLVWNANMLDYLLTHTHIIPDALKAKVSSYSERMGRKDYGLKIFFWGTIYSDQKDNLCVRYLCQRDDGQWNSGYEKIDDRTYIDRSTYVVALSVK